MTIENAAKPIGSAEYRLRISRLTVDKLGVKLYDKASAVVAELVANSYDADASVASVSIPLNVSLATVVQGTLVDKGYEIVVEDDGHGMTPDEAREFYLRVGADRRRRGGELSRTLRRPVMGRKGIGKLAPFGICRTIEVWSAGGPKTSKGYLVSHFVMEFDKIVTDDDADVPLETGSDDGTWAAKNGTRIVLRDFLAKRVPDSETFMRQLAMRFTLAKQGFDISVTDALSGDTSSVDPLNIPLADSTKIDVSDRPVVLEDGRELSVTGWLAMAKDSYKNEETAGVRLYARDKLVATTRDFNQPAGFTGEFTMRSYLVGSIVAEWLDLDDGEDLVRTDRQDIIWDSEYGEALREWGKQLIKEIAKLSAGPRREKTKATFLQKSDIAARADAKFGDASVTSVAVRLAGVIGGFAADDELEDEDYVNDLAEVVLSVAPYQALMESFHEFAKKTVDESVTLDGLLEIFDKNHIAELAAYAQVSQARIRVIDELAQIVNDEPVEAEFQKLIASAPWLINPSWTVITKNQSLKTFAELFQKYWQNAHDESIEIAFNTESIRPDFTAVSLNDLLHFVEIKKAGHKVVFDDIKRLLNYAQALQELFDAHADIATAFSRGWKISLVADGQNLTDAAQKLAVAALIKERKLEILSWGDFLHRARVAHEQFLDIRDARGS